MEELTPEKKKEIKEYIENLSTVYTDTVSLIWEALGL